MSSNPLAGVWLEAPAHDDVPPYSIFTGKIEKGDLDTRDYKLLKLQNGIRAIVVHDDTADKAAACAAVQVGAIRDPPDMQGMAHFCEHMLLKGSEKYPDENDFFAYITANGGQKNGVTGVPHAYYYFSIGSASLHGGLSRLADFLHAPLLTESLVKREIYAVDSEFKRNNQKDGRRIFQLTKSLSMPGHPFCLFPTGNVESLTEGTKQAIHDGRINLAEGEDEEILVWRELRRRLVEWWQREYCAERITVAAVGRESVEELSGMLASLFSPIPNRGVDPRPVVKDPVWGPSEMGSIIFIKTIKDYFGFSLSFMIPDQRPFWRFKPGSILAHFLGHEGPGSICAYLKKKGWLEDLSADCYAKNPNAPHIGLDGRLTKEGYTHYKDVLLAIYNYLDVLRSSLLDAYHFSEMQKMAEVSFQYKEKTEPHTYAILLAMSLAEEYPPEWILNSAALYREWNEPLVRKLIALLVPERGRVTLQAKEHSEEIVGRVAQWSTERWYGTQYCVQRLDTSLVEKIKAPNKNIELFLPTPNPYIPEDFNVERIQVPEPAKLPRCIHRTPLSTLWFKKDDQFWVPKAVIRIDIRSPISYGTARQAVMARLLADLVEDALSEVTYDASLAGMSYSVSNHRRGLLVYVGGYNDKLPVLLDTVLKKLRNLVIDPERLKVIADKLTRSYKNYYLGQPSNLSDDFAAWCLLPITFSPEEKLSEIPLITADDLQRYKTEYLAKVHLEALINGNIQEEQAKSVIYSVEQLLTSRSLLPAEIRHGRSLEIPIGSNFIYRKTHANEGEVNSSLSYYCQFGVVTNSRLRPVLQLLAHIIREPVFSQLRTREQLGYVVSSSLWIVSTSMGLGFKVQSVRSPWDVEQRLNAFLEDFYDVLANMSAEEFNDHKEGLIVKKLERVKNLGEETTRFWYHISSEYYDFLRHEIDANAIRALQLVDVIDAFDEFVRPSSSSRKKISVHLVSQTMKDEPQSLGAVVVTDESLPAFKNSLACYPAAVPRDSLFYSSDSLGKAHL